MNDSREFSVDYYFSEKILKTLGLNETENIKKQIQHSFSINCQLRIINLLLSELFTDILIYSMKFPENSILL
ncbi:hypothetical protein LDL59_06130 [Kaistella anthropi]|nr:hypothetical protein [Kaistella anthropi]